MKKFIVFLLILAVAGGYYWFYHRQATAVKATATQEKAAVKAPEPVSPVTPEDCLSQRQYQKARELLEKVPAEKRDRDWQRRMAESLDGIGDREKADEMVDSLISSAAAEEKAGLMWWKAQMLLDGKDQGKAEEQCYAVFIEHRASPEAQNAAFKLRTIWAEWKDFDAEKLVRLNRVLSFILEKTVDDSVAAECVKTLCEVNLKLFGLPNEVQGLFVFHKVKPGEYLSTIAKQYKVYPDRILRSNGIKWEKRNDLQVGKILRIIPGRLRIMVNRDKFVLTAYLGDMFFKRYKIGIGKDGQTPKTTTQISKSMVHNPTYQQHATGEILPAEHPDNPLGSRWIGFEMGQGYGIHGTKDPSSIGKPSSNGCVRLHNADVEELYDYVMTGDEVVIE